MADEELIEIQLTYKFGATCTHDRKEFRFESMASVDVELRSCESRCLYAGHVSCRPARPCSQACNPNENTSNVPKYRVYSFHEPYSTSYAVRIARRSMLVTTDACRNIKLHPRLLKDAHRRPLLQDLSRISSFSILLSWWSFRCFCPWSTIRAT